MHFVHRVIWAIYHRIESHIEDMLVIRRVEAWCDKHPILGLDVGGNRPGRHAACEFYLVLHRTILVKIPVESVLVIADSSNTLDHQAAPAPYLGLNPSPIDI